MTAPDNAAWRTLMAAITTALDIPRPAHTDRDQLLHGWDLARRADLVCVAAASAARAAAAQPDRLAARLADDARWLTDRCKPITYTPGTSEAAPDAPDATSDGTETPRKDTDV